MNRSFLFTLLGLALGACRADGTDKYETPAERSPSAGAQTSADRRPERQDATPAIVSADAELARKALRGGQFEIETSRLAVEKSTSGKIRDFAKMMIADHGQANRELADLMKKKGVEAAAATDAELDGQVAELELVDGPDFDRAYVRIQVEAHDAAIRLFERAEQECQDEDLREFVSKSLPVLRMHRGRLDDIDNPTGGDQRYGGARTATTGR